jgi:poly(3-hydroxybutyrate) depolymerase
MDWEWKSGPDSVALLTSMGLQLSDFTDDVGFFRRHIAALQSSVEPDPKKIYVTGLSSGALMSHRLGVQLSDLVAGIGVVEGALNLERLLADSTFFRESGRSFRSSGRCLPNDQPANRRAAPSVCAVLSRVDSMAVTMALVEWSSSSFSAAVS